MAEKTSAAAKTSEPGARGARREAPPPAALGLASSFLDLQSAVGNRGVGRLLGGGLLQPKLHIGPAGDAYEREADRVAAAVVGNGRAAPISEADGGVQRMCPECEEELVQRMCSECQKEEEEELVQPKADGPSPSAASPAFEARLGSLRGSGRPLPADLRSFFEPRFGHDFGAVRVHTGNAAGEAAQEVSARAFTVGKDVVFGAGEWSPGTTSGKRLLAHELTHVVQQTPREARRKPLLQRAPQEEGEAAPATEETVPETEPAPETTPGEPGTAPAAAEAAPAAAIVVDDAAEEVPEGQMKKSDFLARLRTEVCAATEASLAGTAYSAQGCPLIEFWFGYYAGISVERINRDLPRFVDAEPRPATAADYITVITERVRRSVGIWASTGEITGVPRDLPLPGMSLPGVGAAGVFFKALPGGPRDPGSPQALRSRLGAGRPLDGGLRSRMESAFGRGFGHVRVHTDGHAAGLSRSLNARAFTVGEHVAFGPRQYRPGTIAGDALIAHELAHVAQQGGAAAAVQPMSAGGASYGALERDADLAAVGAVASLWGARLPGLRRPLRTAPRLRSGLRLQRCGNCNGKEEEASSTAPATTPSTTPAAAPCQPTFQSLSAKTGKIAMTTAWGHCELALGTPSSVGVQFKSEVDVPKGCTGTLEYLQLVDTCLHSQSTAKTYSRVKTGGFVLDTSDPYESQKVSSPGKVTFDTDDSPSAGRAAGNIELFTNDAFKMWLLWRPDAPAGAPRVPLAKVEWNWTAKADKTGSSGGCAADWTVSGASANGGTGSATTTMPKWSKTYPTDFKREPGKC